MKRYKDKKVIINNLSKPYAHNKQQKLNIKGIVNQCILRINQKGNTEYDEQLAKHEINNSLKDIVNTTDNIKSISIIGCGWWNVVLLINHKLYRIWYRKIYNDQLQYNQQLIDILKQADYGILPPISVKGGDKFLYWELTLAEPFQGHTYEELHKMLTKTLKLSDCKLIWFDYNPDNIMTYNNQPIITDFDVQTTDDTRYMIKNLIKQDDKEKLLNTLKKLVEVEIPGRTWWRLPLIVSKYHGYHELDDKHLALNFMRTTFSIYLFMVKYNTPWNWMSKKMFNMLITQSYLI